MVTLAFPLVAHDAELLTGTATAGHLDPRPIETRIGYAAAPDDIYAIVYQEILKIALKDFQRKPKMGAYPLDVVSRIRALDEAHDAEGFDAYVISLNPFAAAHYRMLVDSKGLFGTKPDALSFYEDIYRQAAAVGTGDDPNLPRLAAYIRRLKSR
jgi:hypothetical protein